MADYKELLRRAISALPENNGVARRAVYEKARSALVGQLRAISPPLPARDITQHRLQLEDCIRQVEQEASEAIISLGRDTSMSPRYMPEPPARPVVTAPLATAVVVSKPVEPDAPVEQNQIKPAAPFSIEDIISEAAATSGTTVETVIAPLVPPTPVLRPIPVVPKAGPTSPLTSAPRTTESPLKLPSFEPRQDALPLSASTVAEPPRSFARGEPGLGRGQSGARQPDVSPIILPPTQPVEAALSSVREVDLETAQPGASEAEGVIASAIETLDREARGEVAETPPETAREAADRMFSAPKTAAWTPNETPSFTPVPDVAPRSGGGMTIFLIVFAVLLAGVGGAGFWAWREGYIDLDQMFGQNQAVTETAEVSPATTPTLDPVASTDSTEAVVDGPGNTATTADSAPTTTLDGLQTDDRLVPTPETVVPTGTETTLPDIGATEEPKGEERLSGDDTSATDVNDPAASVDPAVLAGSQSLLLEASADGRTGAVPFSGTIEWTEGSDELGLPTIIGNASIPARNLSVQLTIRKNTDPSLPASHLMEVDFNVNDTFIGGTIANLPGVLLKNEELVPGTPLVGASARVVGNSFLFALSASANDVATNVDLLEKRRWMDLAVVYGTGRNAIITLEKDDAAQAMFDTVFTAWAQ